MKPIIEQLKEGIQGWEDSLKIRKLVYSQCKKDLVDAEKHFKHNRKAKSWAYRQVVEAKKEIKKAKSKLSSYLSRKRRWAKDNMDKVLELIEE